MTVFKICGLRETQPALTAAAAGCSFLGFVFVPGVARQVTQKQALGIIEEVRRVRGKAAPFMVGLFANQSVECVNKIIGICDLDYAQLCGDEDPGYWKEIDGRIIRQIKVDNSEVGLDKIIRETKEEVEQVLRLGYIPLLDKYEKGSLGGTGRSFDWSIARKVSEANKVMLAGGLTPENVREAISVARPWAVDVSTGVESNGTKDLFKIEAFAKEVCR